MWTTVRGSKRVWIFITTTGTTALGFIVLSPWIFESLANESITSIDTHTMVNRDGD